MLGLLRSHLFHWLESMGMHTHKNKLGNQCIRQDKCQMYIQFTKCAIHFARTCICPLTTVPSVSFITKYCGRPRSGKVNCAFGEFDEFIFICASNGGLFFPNIRKTSFQLIHFQSIRVIGERNCGRLGIGDCSRRLGTIWPKNTR